MQTTSQLRSKVERGTPLKATVQEAHKEEENYISTLDLSLF